MIPCKYLAGKVDGSAVLVEGCTSSKESGIDRWKVCWCDAAVTIEGMCVPERIPSERSEAFLQNCRFGDLDTAILAAQRFIKRERGVLYMENECHTASSDLRNLLDRLGVVEKKVSVFENQLDRIIQDFEAALDKLRALNKGC